MLSDFAQRAILAAVLLVLAACAAPPPPPPVPTGLPVGFPVERYADGDVFVVDATESMILVTVRRAGRLKRLGHDHIVASRDVAGFIRLDGDRVRANLYLPVSAMTVDEPELRAAAGFDSEPSDEDRAGTLGNMLKSIDAVNYAFTEVALDASWSGGSSQSFPVDVTVRGVTRRIDVPLGVSQDDDRIVANGRFSILQSDFGIEPFAVLGGAIRVDDQLDIEVRVVAVSNARTTTSLR